ncbi:MAG TPA: RagB/SusD family nutrient uptake outer membrane protein [Chryseolinea sp.]|nr:RagB/SusD family nutrient uptake outer membrane protein [Chryseolinea sp.]
MNKKLYFILTLLLLACSDQLEEDSLNPNFNIPEIFFKTETDAVSSINAVYNALIVDGFYNRMGAAMADARSDELIGRSPWDVLSTVGNFVMPATSAGAPIIWEGSYILISRANQTLEGVADMQINQDLKNRVLGQAYFLRALGHYQLTIYYKDVPVITKVSTLEDRFPTTSTQADVWAQIKSDLEQAKSLLPASYNDVTGPDQGQNQRVTLDAAQALLGKAHLYTQQWQAAETEFDAIITAGRHALTPRYADNFTENPGIEQSNPEPIFQVEFTNDESPDLNWGGVPSATWRQFSAIAPTYAARGFGFFDFYPSKWLYDQMKLEKTIDGKTDPRLLATILSYEPTDEYTTAYTKDWLTPAPAGAGFLANEIFIKKFTRADLGRTSDTEVLNSGINYPVIRYADVLLMNAEAKNEQGKTALAAGLIQQVRDRANLPDREAEFAAFSKEQMRDQIAHERLMEFAIEGSRINDIIRWGWFNNPTKVAELKTHDPEFANWTPGKEYLPVPQIELDRNPNLSKNSAN